MMRFFNRCSALLLGALVAVPALCGYEIVLPSKAQPNMKAAAELLDAKLKKIKKPSDGVTIRFVHDAKLDPESWRVEGDGKIVTITAGEWGFCIGAGHYLEECCAVTIVSPQETYVARGAAVNAKFKTISGKPAFIVRDVYYPSRFDGGVYAALRGLNAQGELGPLPGGRNFYGSPKFCHTFHLYFPPKKTFAEHPEFFSEIKGKRTIGEGLAHTGSKAKSQLCLANKELRKLFAQKVIATIKKDREKAAAANQQPPLIYDVSQNDNPNFCQCAECRALRAKYGDSYSGAMLEFVNEIAAEVETVYPDVTITTFSYQKSEDIPVGIKPRSNVMIVLANTGGSCVRSLNHPDNKPFLSKIQGWRKLTDKLKIWDYSINFAAPEELPYNSEDSYQETLRAFRANGVTHIFTEFENEALSDARDYKLYLLTSLMENPDRNLASLKKGFCHWYFGAAAPYFLQYRDLLKKSQEKHSTFLNFFPQPSLYRHLDLETVLAAQKIFDDALKAVKGDTLRIRHLEKARLSLDRATLVRSRMLKGEYVAKHGSLEGYPFDHQFISERIRAAAKRAALRLPAKERGKFLKKMEAEIRKYSAEIPEKALVPPEKFRSLPPEKVFDYTMENAKIYMDCASFVADPEAETGRAMRLVLPNKYAKLEDHVLPMPCGLYSQRVRHALWKAKPLTAKQVPGPGYHWYKMGESFLSPDAYLFFFRSWVIQQTVTEGYFEMEPDAKFEIWVRLKFTGPHFPHGKEGDPDAVWFERIVLIKK